MKKPINRVIGRLRASRVAFVLASLYRPEPSIIRPPYELLTLEPRYDKESHGLYSELLIYELEKSGDTAPRSIALTGPYGSGKSSVIDRVKEHFGSRAISISLPTLGEGVIEEKLNTAQSTASNRMSKTNVVQKRDSEAAPLH